MSFWHYSPATGGFYPADVFAPADLPTDAVAISAETWEACMDGQAAGLMIAPDADGQPRAVARPALPTPVPQTVTRLQARLTCLDLPAPEGSSAANLWAALTAWDWPSPQAQAFFEDAQTWRRDDPLLLALAEDLGLSASALDALFTLAATR